MRQRTFLLTVLLAALMMLGLTACGAEEEPHLTINEAQANGDLQANLESNLQAMATAGAFLRTSAVACDTTHAMPMGTLEGGGSTTDPTAPEPTPEPTTEVDCASTLDLSDPTNDLIETLTQDVFVASNLEKTTDTTLTYRLGPQAVCPASVSSGDPEPVYDPDCVQMLESMPVRFEVSSRTAGDLDVAVKVGPEQTKVATLEIYRTQLAVEADLGQIADAYEQFGRTEQPDFDFPGEVDGTVRLELVRNGEQDFTVSASVVEAIHIAVDGSLFEHDEGITFDLARAVPAVSARIDGAAQEIALSWSLGALDLSMPAALLGGTASTCASDPVTGTFECTETQSGPTDGTLAVHVDGVGATMLLSALSETIELTGLGLGDGASTLSLDGTPLVTVDLNKDAGRSFDATLSTSPTGGLQIAVRPSFNLSVALAFASVTSQWPGVDGWMLDELLEITLDGAEAPTVAMTDAGELEVVAGQLALSSKTHGQVVVAAGQCAVSGTSESTDGHPFAEVAAGECGQVQEPTPAPTP